ncbi:MAG: acyltransferase family protein [Sarcina sp.]
MKYLIFNQFNLIKIFCCFLVVYQHIIDRFLNSANATISTHLIYGTLLNFSRFAVPTFLFITGFVLIKSYEDLSLTEFYKTKFLKILYIYIGANLLFIIPKLFLPDYSIKLFFTDIIWSKSVPHLWYMNTLIKIYLFFPVFKFIVFKLHNLLSYKAIILITFIQYFISNSAYSILSKGISPIIVTIFTYLDRSLITWSYYVILGGLVYKNFNFIYAFIQKYKKIFIALYTVSFIYINHYTFDNFSSVNVNYYRSSPSAFRILVYSMLSIVVLYYIADFIVKQNNYKVLQVSKNLSNHILNIYITHPIVIGISALIMFAVEFLPHNIAALLIISLVMIISVLPFYLYEMKKRSKLKIIK